MDGPSNALSPGLLTIDLAALAANYRLLCQKVGRSCAVAGIVKADAYGLGMARVAPVLEREGCRHFFTATLEEAIALRALTALPIYVLGGYWRGAEREYDTYRLTPVMNSLDDIARFRKTAAQKQARLKAVLHFDTGMNRLGLGRIETRAVLNDLSLLESIDTALIMSHFVAADAADSPLTAKQGIIFGAIARHFPHALKSLANSSGLWRDDKAWHFDMVRPGMALYGLNPTPETKNPMTPVVALSTRLLQVRAADKGDTVGYGATYRLTKATSIGTVALGYADGFFRAGTAPEARVLYYKDTPCPVIGRVSMDLVTVDLGHTGAAAGDNLEVLGLHQAADTLATASDTIGYEVLTALGRRWARRYNDG